MNDQESQAQQSITSDSISESARLKQRARLLHMYDIDYEEFCVFAEKAHDDLAATFLDMLAELFEILQLSQGNPQRGSLTGFASGAESLSWERFILKFNIQKGSSTETKLVQLAFLRRYPDLFNHDGIDLEAKLKSLELPLAAGRSILEAKIQPKILDLDIISKGYTSAYVGHDDIVTPTLNTLNIYVGLWQPHVYFAPYTCLIGPTMIGKSRLLMELAEEVCVVNICLRNKGSSGEPRRSLLADDMLPTSSPDYKRYYIKLIAAILSVTARFFESAQANNTQMYKQWSKHQTTTQFHQDVQEAMSSQSNLNLKSGTDPAVTQLRRALREVQANAFLNVPGLKVLLAIDEASAMLEIPKDQEIPLFRFFRRAMREILPSTGIFVILVDTTSRVSNFLPTNREDRSSRALGPRGQPPIKLFAPIYQIRTFDRMVPPLPPQNWHELFLPDRLCKYGVPFFSIYLNDLIEEDGAVNFDTAIPQMASYALGKLLCSEMITDSLLLTDARALALLGPTIGVPLHGQAHLNVDLTASHAAHCGYLDPTRESQHSFYPSQPIYALAANDYLQKNEDVLIRCIRCLTSIISQGYVYKGEVGELASRIILLCAMNKTATKVKIEESKAAHLLKTPNQLDTTPPVIKTTFPSPVPVSKFLETLTGLPANQLPLGTIDDRYKTKLLRKGMMFWNHFLHRSSTPSLGSLMEGLERGLAVQCHHEQPVFDQFLPIYLKDRTRVKLEEKNLTFCGIQAKNRKNDNSLTVTQGKMTPRNAGIETNDDNPYLALHFSLQSNPPNKNSLQSNPPNEDTGNARKPENYRLRCSGPPDPRQASLVFHGLQAFDFLSPQLKAALEQLIDIGTDLISRHKDEPLGKDYAKDFLMRDEKTREAS